MTFAELMARFVAEGCAQPYHDNCLKQLAPFFETVPIAAISKALAAKFRQQRYQCGQVLPATVNRDLSVLRRLLSWAVEQGWLLANPLSRVKMEPERRPRRLVLSVEEEDRLLAVCPQHLRPLVIAALDSGMRRGELFSQRWEDVDLQRGLLSVSCSKTAGGTGREIPLTARLQELLSAARKERGLVFGYHGQQLHSIKLKRECGACVSYQFLRKRLVRLRFAPAAVFEGVQFQELEEQIYGLPIYKQEWFKKRRHLQLR